MVVVLAAQLHALTMMVAVRPITITNMVEALAHLRLVLIMEAVQPQRTTILMEEVLVLAIEDKEQSKGTR